MALFFSALTLCLMGCGDEQTSHLVYEDVNLTEAKYLYNYNCATCHKPDATGRVGPNIQGACVERIEYAFASVGLMYYLNNVLEPYERFMVSAYLQTLSLEDNLSVCEMHFAQKLKEIQ